MKKEIDPKVAMGVGGAILAVALLAGYFALNKEPAKVDVSQAPASERADADPPRRGQPGYRQRTTDAPAPGDGAAAPPSRN